MGGYEYLLLAVLRAGPVKGLLVTAYTHTRSVHQRKKNPISANTFRCVGEGLDILLKCWYQFPASHLPKPSVSL